MLTAVKKILVPIQGHKADEAAFRIACRISRDNKGKLFALHVIEVDQRLPVDSELPVQTASGEAILERIEVLGHAEKCIVEADIVQARRAGAAIVQESIDKQVELLVLGVPFKSRFGSGALGQAAIYVLANSICPVILWKEPAPSDSNMVT